MTKKDYILVAEAIRKINKFNSNCSGEYRRIASVTMYDFITFFSDEAIKDNPKFNK